MLLDELPLSASTRTPARRAAPAGRPSRAWPIDPPATACSLWNRQLQCVEADLACAWWFGRGGILLQGATMQTTLEARAATELLADAFAALRGDFGYRVVDFRADDGTPRRGLVQCQPIRTPAGVFGILLQIDPSPWAMVP